MTPPVRRRPLDPCQHPREPHPPVGDRPGPVTPIECSGCGRYMRPRLAKAEDWPGWVAHRGRGLCGACHKRKSRSGDLDRFPRQRRGGSRVG